MPGCRAAIDDHVGIACDNYCGAAMPLPWTGNLVAYPRDTLAFRIGGRCALDYGAAMTRCVTYHDEWSGHDPNGFVKISIIRMIISMYQNGNYFFGPR